MVLAPTLLLNAGSGAIVRPTFSRDFAGEKTLNNGTGPSITFTRASDATYFDADGVLQTASSDTPRFDHDPATGASRGLLIEESRQNLFQRSAEFDNAYWTKTESSIDSNVETAPDGSTTADKLKTNTNSGLHSINTPSNLSVTSGLAYSLSVFAKKAEKDILYVTFSSAGFTAPTASFFNLTAGTVIAGANVTASMTSVGNGWYRCIATKTATATVATDVFRIGVTEDSTSITSTGANSTDGLYIWGAQREQGAFPTSYIPTTSAAVTRSADSAVVTPISSFYNQAEGTLFAEFSRPQVSKFSSFLHFDDTTGNEMIALETGVAAPATQRFQVIDGNSAQAQIGNYSSATANTVYRMAGAYAVNDFAVSQNGSAAATDTGGTLPTITRMAFSVTPSATYIRKVAYFPKRLSNALLETLTT